MNCTVGTWDLKLEIRALEPNRLGTWDLGLGLLSLLAYQPLFKIFLNSTTHQIALPYLGIDIYTRTAIVSQAFFNTVTHQIALLSLK